MAPPGWFSGMRLDDRAVGPFEGLAGLKAAMLEAGGEMVEGDREDRRGEEPVEGLLGVLSVQVAAMGADDALAAEDGRLEERQAADMVEMQMAEEDIDLVGGGVAEFGAEGGDAGAGVDDEEPAAAADFDTGGVTAEFHELRTRRTRRTAHAPEADLERILAYGHSPRHHITVTLLSRYACALSHIRAPRGLGRSSNYRRGNPIMQRRVPILARDGRSERGCPARNA